MTTLFGIHNCDTVKKAQKWLNEQNVSFEFHDFRKDGITTELVESFVNALPVDKLVNKRSTTYRQLDEEVKNSLSVDNVIPLLVEQPTLIKRPVLLTNNKHFVGFKAAEYQEIFS